MGADKDSAAIDARIRADTEGTILFDAGVSAQVTHAWFDAQYWREHSALVGQGGGRGAVSFIAAPPGACVLRHYHRGGMVAQMLGDRYLWNGREQTRSFREFRLLAGMIELRLPVPVPVAARYCRRGLYYTADLITGRIEDSETLALRLQKSIVDEAEAARVGATIAQFHAHGVYHADLNAHNILVSDKTIHLIDFDRGELRGAQGSWCQSNLRRLRRSLLKLTPDDQTRLDRELWSPLMAAYESAGARK